MAALDKSACSYDSKVIINLTESSVAPTLTSADDLPSESTTEDSSSEAGANIDKDEEMLSDMPQIIPTSELKNYTSILASALGDEIVSSSALSSPNETELNDSASLERNPAVSRRGKFRSCKKTPTSVKEIPKPKAKTTKVIKGPEGWKYNVRKKLREKGLPYSRKDGSEQPAKKLKPTCECKTVHTKCKKFTDKDRQEIFNTIWKLSWPEKKDYILELVDRHVPKRRYRNKGLHHKENTFDYHLKKDGVKLLVCRKLFLNTTGLTEWFVRATVRFPDKEAHTSRPQNSYYDRSVEDKIFLLEEFLTKLSSEKSNHGKFYLHPAIKTMAELHRRYSKKCEETGRKPLSLKTVKEEMDKANIFLSKEMKEESDICFDDQVEDFLEEFPEEVHEVEKEPTTVNDELSIDRDRAQGKQMSACTECSEKVCVVCMGLGHTLLAPNLKLQELEDKLKLSVYNFTFVDMATNDSALYVWHEGEGGNSPSDITSCVIDYLKSKLDYDTIILYSDGLQETKNTVLASALSQFAATHKVCIEQKFFVDGHSISDVDKVYTVLYKAFERTPIYVPMDYITVFHLALHRSKPNEVNYLDHTFFYDYASVETISTLAPPTRNQNSHPEQIKCLRYSPHKILQYKCSLDKPWSDFPGLPKHERRPELPPKLYSSSLKIPETKFQDLQEMKSHIVKDHHPFYDSLSH